MRNFVAGNVLRRMDNGRYCPGLYCTGANGPDEPGHLLYLLPADLSMPPGRHRRVEQIVHQAVMNTTATVVTVNTGDYQMLEVWLDPLVEPKGKEEATWYVRFDRFGDSNWSFTHIDYGLKENRPTRPEH